jgi:cellulose biosynthesis protein BcsQ
MICTFYSYKGGVGRSMAMANVADILSRRGLRVLMIDFDLEAPGLEQFFHTNVEGVRRHPGLLDLLLSYKQSMSVAREGAAFKNVDNFIVAIYEQLPGGGRLDLMPAGQRQSPEQLARYALALRTFDWQDFYYNWEGDLFFEWLRRSLGMPRYDLILVDSRTGVTEMGGICGYQLADVIVMFCAPNNQNMQGTANMLRDFRSASVEGLRHGRALDIVVVPARVEQRDPVLLDEFFRRFDENFRGLMPQPLASAGITSRDLMIPYEPLYAFQERVVSDPEQAGERRRIGAVFEKLADAVALFSEPTSRLVEGASRAASTAGSAVAPAISTTTITEAKYDAARRFAGYDVYLDSSHPDAVATSSLADSLRARGLQVFLDKEDIAAGAEWVSVAEEALFHSRALVFCVGSSGLSEWRQRLLRKAIDARARGQTLMILPVLLPGASTNFVDGTPLREFTALDLREGVDAVSAADAVARAITGGGQARIETETRAPYVGKAPFGEQHADLFFGRDALLREVLAAIAVAPTILITGPSGCGKTSLVRAGLFPALRAQTQTAPWAIATVSVMTRPLDALAEAVAELRKHGSGARLLLFVDQTEKLAELDVRQRTEFLARLQDLSLQGPVRPTIVLAVRSDARRFLLEESGAGVIATAAVIEIKPMGDDDLRRIISAPAECVGLAFEPGLVDRIQADLQAGSASLALGQQLLFAVWERRRSGWLTNAAYADLGGMQGLVARHADEIYREFPDDQRAVMRSIMLRLVRLGREGESTRRRVPRRVLAPPSKEPTRQLDAHTSVLNVLIEAGLLVASEDNGEPVVEVAHEALVRKWPQLQQWLAEEREFLEWRERLASNFSAWEAAGRVSDLLLHGVALSVAEDRLRANPGDLSQGEQQYITASRMYRDAQAVARERRRRWITGALATVASVAVLCAGIAFVKWKEAVQKGKEAVQKQELAEQGAALAYSQAESARQQAESTNTALMELRVQLEAIENRALEAARQRDAQAAELQRAQATAKELRATLGTVEKLQKKTETTQADSGKKIQEIKDLQRRVLR